jgi:acyl carrier protein
MRHETAMTDLEKEIAVLIVKAVDLEQPAESIDPDAPLYGDTLGLDSIDILENAVVISKEYGIELHSENVTNEKIFASLRALSRHVAENRTL